MSTPLVSIVIPVFNGEKYIKVAIKSILNQTHERIELIVVDDGSTDKTYKILQEYSSKIKIIKQENQGQSVALNNGWKLSKGDVLGYLSCDDELQPDCISECVGFLNDGVEIVYPNYSLIDSNNEFIKEVDLGPFNHKGLYEELICYPGPGALFTRKIYKRVGGWKINLTQVPDFEFWLRASEYGNFYRVNKNLANFRVHPDSGSVKKISRKKCNEIIYVMRSHSNKIASKGFSKRKSLSNAFLISSYHHIKAKRFFTISYYLILSLFYSPRWLTVKKILLHLATFIKKIIKK